MPESIPFLLERLRAEGEKTAAFFASLGVEQWQLPVYTDGETWTIRSLFSHFVSSERELLRLFANICEGGAGAAEDFDLDRFNASQQRKLAASSPPQLLEQFRAARADTIGFVSALNESDLERQGRHPFLGIMPLGDMIKVVYRHNRLHERDLQQVLTGSTTFRENPL